MSEEVKEAIIKLKHYANITTHWKQEEFTDSEIDNYIKLALNYIDKLQTKYEKQKRINLEQNQFIDTLKTNIIKLQKENEELKSKKQLEIDTSEEVLKWKGKYHLLSRENAELKEKIKEYEIGIVKE